MTLDCDDIQHILLTRAPALTGRYEFLSFKNAAGGRAWLSAMLEKVHSAKAMRETVAQDKRWVTVALTFNGLRALGVDEASLATFPEEFRQGMVARAEMLGDAGENHPDKWIDKTNSPDLHAIAILFARDAAERGRCAAEHEKFLAQCDGVEVLSTLDLEAIPPFDHAHDHFGYRDRLSQPAIEGSGDTPTPGSGAPLKAGEFILGYPDENGHVTLPQPEILSRNGSFMAYRRMEEHVGKFRDFLRTNGSTPQEQELVAAKLMGRWRSGAPLVLAPEKDDAALGADPQRKQRLQLQAAGPARLCRAAGLSHPPNESARHGGEHESAPHDPSRRDLRPTSA
jgi:deferrochelatase/peroxidase EfeB